MNTIEIMVTNPDYRNMYTISQIASKSLSDVRAVKGSANIDAKSIMGVLTLGLREGDLVTFESDDVVTLKNIAGIA